MFLDNYNIVEFIQSFELLKLLLMHNLLQWWVFKKNKDDEQSASFSYHGGKERHGIEFTFVTIIVFVVYASLLMPNLTRLYLFIFQWVEQRNK